MKKIHRIALPKIKTIEVSAGVRYWEDADVNEIEDTLGDKIPCRMRDSWCPVIEAETGIIHDWPKGVVASIHYKVCDEFSAIFKDADNHVVAEIEDDYVPEFMSPKDAGYGDYIIMDIDATGKIQDWDFSDEMVTENQDE